MTLIVEDGTIVANANTYITEVEANDILAFFGYAPLQVATAEARLTSAALYLEGFADKFKGSKVEAGQSLQWPRVQVCIDGFPFAADEIPVQLKRCQALAAQLIDSGVNLYSNTNGQEIIQKTVDVISVTYSETGVAGQQPKFGQLEAMLAALLKSSSLNRSVRV